MTIAQNFNYMCMMQTNFVQESLKPILKHNKECMLETDWHGKFKEQIIPVIQNVLATSDPVLDK